VRLGILDRLSDCRVAKAVRRRLERASSWRASARCCAAIRSPANCCRRAAPSDALTAFAGWELNLRSRRLISPEGRRVELTNGEFNLLQGFCAAGQRVLTREQLLELSRLHSAEVYDRSIDVQILRLRRKIEPDPARPQYIRTERGVGYVSSVSVEVLL
jgi:DNA-binding response OmpR family regulator